MTMVSNSDKWRRIFDVPDTSYHRKGFTIYKIISMLYPEECPDAITKITVWKRFNEFKKLHRDLKHKHRTLRLKDRFPILPNNPFFRRFDKDVISERKDAILHFLEFVAKHPQLFTSNEFVKFFETSHTPTELISGSINSIRADLHLPTEPEYLSFCSPNSDDERTLSDTDSISTLSSLSPSVQAIDLLSDPLHRSTNSLTRLSKRLSSESSLGTSLVSKVTLIDSQDSLSISTINESVSTIEDQMFPTPPQTPSLSNTEISTQYIVDAAHFIIKATEMELEKEYDKAFSAYKAGIDILLKSGKGDKDLDRRVMVRHKIEKYMLRAEKIYNLYLSPEMKNVQELAKVEVERKVPNPVSDLYKYKVINVIESGMLVIHSDTQQLFYVKVIHKTWKFSNDDLVLPENVPYMIKLYNYYNCENTLFLVLQYSCGVKLKDFLKQHTYIGDSINNSYIQNVSEINSDDSEGSYSDLINDYMASKIRKETAEIVEPSEVVNTDCVTKNVEELNVNENINTDETECDNFTGNVIEDLSGLEINDIVTKFEKLLCSVESAQNSNKESNIVIASKEKHKTVTQKVDKKIGKKLLNERKLSDRSLCDDFDLPENLVNIQDIVKWAAQLLIALEKLHLYGVICCDLDFKNLLVDGNGDLILTYMCSLLEGKQFSNKADQSLAPELYSFEKVTPAVDWWSYGTILYELLVGQALKNVHPEGISSYTSLKIPRFVSPEARSLLKQLLTYEPHQRLGCGVNGTEEIKSHPFFNSISWSTLHSIST